MRSSSTCSCCPTATTPRPPQAERAAWEDLRAALADSPNQPQVEVYYRLRTRRTHRKAGNVADFCRRWGNDYSYMVVLDADSVMSGDCLTAMVKLMEANPTAGIIQTATQAIGHVTLHARAQQFASRVTGRLFTLGMQFWQTGRIALLGPQRHHPRQALHGPLRAGTASRAPAAWRAASCRTTSSKPR